MAFTRPTRTGFQPKTEGPFLCLRCEYFRQQARKDGVTCNKPEVQADPVARHGKVEAEDCCDYFDRNKAL